MCGVHLVLMMGLYVVLYGVNLPLSVSAEQNVTGAVGGTVTLPSGVQSVSVQDVVSMDWKFKGKAIAQFTGGKTNPDLSPQFRGRIQVSDQSGDLTLTQLRLDDSGTYTFTGISQEGPRIPKKIINLQVYELIQAVRIQTEVVYRDNGRCLLTLTCQVTGGGHVSFCWLKGGRIIPGTTSVAVLEHIAHPTDSALSYNCTAFNPVSSLSAFALADCNTLDFRTTKISLCVWKTVLFSVGLVMMVSAVIGVHIRETLRNRPTDSTLTDMTPDTVLHLPKEVTEQEFFLVSNTLCAQRTQEPRFYGPAVMMLTPDLKLTTNRK